MPNLFPPLYKTWKSDRAGMHASLHDAPALIFPLPPRPPLLPPTPPQYFFNSRAWKQTFHFSAFLFVTLSSVFAVVGFVFCLFLLLFSPASQLRPLPPTETGSNSMSDRNNELGGGWSRTNFRAPVVSLSASGTTFTLFRVISTGTVERLSARNATRWVPNLVVTVASWALLHMESVSCWLSAKESKRCKRSNNNDNFSLSDLLCLRSSSSIYNASTSDSLFFFLSFFIHFNLKLIMIIMGNI